MIGNFRGTLAVGLAVAMGAIGVPTAAMAVPIAATVTTAYSCGAGSCSYGATGTGLTDLQIAFDIPQWGSAGTPTGMTLTGMTVTITGSYNTVGSVGAGSGGANNATISTDSITTSGVPVATIIGGFVGLGGNNPSSLNFLVSSSDLLASQNLGNIAANGSAAVNYSKTFSLVNLNSIDSALIGLGTYLVEFGTSTYITTGASSGNTSADVATSETLNLALTYTYEEAPPPPVPEPASMALLGSGLLGLGMMIRRRRRS